jgi:hypothetical protein
MNARSGVEQLRLGRHMGEFSECLCGWLPKIGIPVHNLATAGNPILRLSLSGLRPSPCDLVKLRTIFANLVVIDS